MTTEKKLTPEQQDWRKSLELNATSIRAVCKHLLQCGIEHGRESRHDREEATAEARALLWAAAELLEFECGFVELEDEYYADDDTDD